MQFFNTFGFISPYLIVMILPLIGILAIGLSSARKTGVIPYTGLEYLRTKKTDTSVKRKYLRTILWGLLIAGFGLLWINPITYSTNPLFGGATQVNVKQFIIAFDISPSMNLTMGEITEERKRGLSVNEEGVTKFEVARDAALHGFLDRFSGNAFGLVLFSTEPFLARWPTVETENMFSEVLGESLRRGSGSQLESYSGLTNTDKALYLARDMVHKSATMVVDSSAIVLIADAWDNVEAVEQAITDIRGENINLYIIGTGVPEDIVEKLTEDFADDEGFRIFHVDSEAEMAQAYYLIGNIEESETFAINERFETNVRWLVALVLTILSVFIIWALEVPLLRSRTDSI